MERQPRQQSKILPKQSRPYITIEYAHTDKTHKIFLKYQRQTFYRMEKDGRIIHSNFIKFSRAFRDMFTKVGYNFVPEKRIYTKGKKRVFGIDVTVKKIDEDDKRIIRVKIEGATVDDVIDKERKIEREVRAIIHEDPEIRLWERLEMC